MKQLMILLFYFIYAPACFAQFNDSTHYLTSFASTGIVNNTNNGSSFVITNAFRLGIRKKSISLNSTNSWIYGQQEDRLTNNDFTALLDFNLYKTFKNFYYWGLMNYDKSYSLKINNRLQAGAGVAYSFVDNESAFFNLSNGILYESSDLNLSDSAKSVFQTMRNSLRVRYRFVIHKIVVLDGSNFWQPSFSDGKDYILKFNNSLSFKLNKWLSFTTAAAYNKLNRTHRENLLLTFGLTLEKYF
jgi:hypothetical protein